MPQRISHDDLMRFIDGELSPSEHARMEELIAGDTELAREAAIFRAMSSACKAFSGLGSFDGLGANGVLFLGHSGTEQSSLARRAAGRELAQRTLACSTGPPLRH